VIDAVPVPAVDRRTAVADAFAGAVESGFFQLPLPGGGQTDRRWAALTALAADDLCVARLAEAHLDALAILAELGGPSPGPGSRWGVWAARPAVPVLAAHPVGDGWTLTGTKPWCSGARAVTHALVTAEAPDGYRLFAVELADTRPQPGTWAAVGMAASDSLDVQFDQAPAVAVGDPDDYLRRPGFWWGAMAVAACWYGGAVGLASTLVRAGSSSQLGPHALAHLGAVDTVLDGLVTAFSAAATAVDADPSDRAGGGERRALRLRAHTEAVATEVLNRVGRSTSDRVMPKRTCSDSAG
jgi:hypothetical protein